MIRVILWICAILVATWTLSLLQGCAPADESTTCARAKNMLGECGVMLPLLESDTCTGTAEEISKCIVTTNGSCDALADLGKHLNQCMTTDGGEIPDDFPQIDAKDSGSDASPKTSSTDDGGTSTVDSSTIDSGAKPSGVFDVTGSIDFAEQQSFQTSRLAVGTYTFSFTTSGAVDVYVRKGYAATTTAFDCETSNPATPCVEPVASSAILYVLVVGEAATSTFSVDAQP